MKVRHFLSTVDHNRVHAAIKSAESGNSGDIVLYITHRKVKDALTTAHRTFRHLNLGRAADQNSLLIFIAPKSQTFALVGGPALHEKVGQAWWDELVALLAGHFKEGRYTDGLVAALDRAGIALRQHFPSTDTDRTGQQDILEA